MAERGKGSLILMLVLIVLGATALTVAGASGVTWAYGCLVGYGGAGMLGIAGWWTNSRAFRSETKEALKFIVVGILVRFILCGVFAVAVLSSGWFEPDGFTGGLLAGIALFLLIEVAGIARSAEGATNRG